MCTELKMLKRKPEVCLNLLDLNFCVASFLLGSLNCLSLFVSVCPQRSDRGPIAWSLTATNPPRTRLWSSRSQRSLMRGSTPAMSALSPLETLRQSCHSLSIVSPSIMTLAYNTQQMRQYVVFSRMETNSYCHQVVSLLRRS